MKPKMDFEIGSKVIVDWRGCLYEAKILKKDTSREKQYFIHFDGWSKNHDEWRAPGTIYPMNSENLRTLREQHEYIKTHNLKPKSKPRAKNGESKKSSDTSSVCSSGSSVKSYASKKPKDKPKLGRPPVKKETVTTKTPVKETPAVRKSKISPEAKGLTQANHRTKKPRS